VDTQERLPFGTMEDVENEALLSNVSAEKLKIMSRAATGII
jgi:hypothetical protein